MKQLLKVGDWVRSDEGDGVIEDIPLTMPDVRMTDGRLLSFNADDLKVIKPSEVVVDFGSGIKGTIEYTTIIVRSNGTKQIDKSWVSVHEGDFIIAKYQINKLKEPLQGIVKKLLKAQEEE